MARKAWLATLCAAASGLGLSSSTPLNSSSTVPADLILRNGKVYTDPLEGPTEGRGKGLVWTQAISIRDGDILSIGRNEAVDRDRGPTTKVIDLKGRVVLPGFNDAHFNLFSGGLSLEHVDLSSSTSLTQLTDKVKAYAAANPLRHWIIGEGWDETLFPDKRLPAKEDLDLAVADKPVMVWRRDHRAVALNTKALDLLHIATGTPDPKHGVIARHDKGSPTGMLYEAAAFDAESRADSPSPEDLRNAILAAQALANRYGISSIQGGPIHGEPELHAIEELYNEHKLKLRLSLWGSLEDPQSFLALKEKYKHLPEDWIAFGGLYGEIDGTISARTAALDDAYGDDPHVHGEPFYEQPRLSELVLNANRSGLPVTLRATGDRAVSMALNALAAAKRQLFNSHLRNRVDDVEVAPPFAFDKFADYRVIVDLIPSRLVSDTEARNEFDARLGPERAREAFPIHSLLTARAQVAFGSGWPNGPANPLYALYAAAFRQNLDGRPLKGWQPAQIISLNEAIDASTLGSAYSTREDHVKGSLREGKYADLVVFNEDPFKARGKALLTIPVFLSIVGGKIVYDGSQPELKAGR